MISVAKPFKVEISRTRGARADCTGAFDGREVPRHGFAGAQDDIDSHFSAVTHE